MSFGFLSSISSWLTSPAASTQLKTARVLEKDPALHELQLKLVNYLHQNHNNWVSQQFGACEDHLRNGVVQHQLQALQSSIPGAGTGVFLLKGTLFPGDIATLYPGVVYEAQHFLDLMAGAAPADDACAPAVPAFTVNNQYLLRQSAGEMQDIFVDGKPDGVSGQLFAASALEASLRNSPVNTAWLRLKQRLQHDSSPHSTPLVSNNSDRLLDVTLGQPNMHSGQPHAMEQVQQQAAMGHLVNHPPPGHGPNVEFQVCPLPSNLPHHLQHFIPTIAHQPGLVQHSIAEVGLFGGRGRATRNTLGGGCGTRWAVVLRAVQKMSAGEGGDGGALELFADYGTDPFGLGYSP